MKRVCGWLAAAGVFVAVSVPHAQTIPAARLAILQIEAKSAPDARDLAVLRSGMRNADEPTARAAIRALGRLGRPALVSDIAQALRFSTPELRSEAAQAIASAFRAPAVGNGTSPSKTAAVPAASVVSATTLLLTRLSVEAEPAVRAALCEALARLPHANDDQIGRVEAALLEAAKSDVVIERLGVVKGLEVLIRRHPSWRARGETVAMLRELVAGPSRDTRVKRLAFAALDEAGFVDGVVLEQVASDPDTQVRWLAMRAAGHATAAHGEGVFEVLKHGRADSQPLVRMEALRAESARATGTAVTCQDLVHAVDDPSLQVNLVALDLLASCGTDRDSVAALDRVSRDLSMAERPRGWHRPAHALLALAKASPSAAAESVGRFAVSPEPRLRLAASTVAGMLGNRELVEKLAHDVARPEPHMEFPGSAPAARTAAERTALEQQQRAELQRLTPTRVRVTIRDVGAIEWALLPTEAPASVLDLARRIERGDFNGTEVAGLLPERLNLSQRGPGANQVPRETGPWPHVRGAVGLAFSENQMAGAQIFINLVDNPSFDFEYPVLAHVLNGMEILDQILEGDVIDRIEILPGS